jgi:integrase
VHAAWSTARRSAELPAVHLHDLRHAGLTLAAQSGATLAEVMRRPGHSSSRAAMIYQHAAERRDAEVAERLGRLVADSVPRGTGT